ncbi:UvrD-helicase domain-containing protein [Xanthomonas arboricola]|uniref:DNA 3'-5' helicase n=1 Tax=Xanthomonas arboricola TaxID=56448 RepID=A0AB73H2L0_9XANT|nr:UvrD-helicase domain-containing protein [Xanthomonas arboricola]MBB5672585.1 hypothetical protein [Xanthomonas arboricola]
MSVFKPTPEQELIAKSEGRVIKVSAFAGTGKSSTFKYLAREKPSQKMLYLAFNKAIKEEAMGSFPSNVKAMTGHGLAYAAKGRIYGAVPQKLQPDMKPYHVLPSLVGTTNHIPKESHNLYGGRVIETVKSFMVSADPDLLPKHVALGESPSEARHMSQAQILLDAKRIWGLMCDPSSGIPMLHDGYLKLYQLSNPRLNYDAVLLDEAQDTNPVLQAIVGAQQARTFYVGDQHQAIYLFRGASNAMQRIKADEEFGLTGSFRFGESVADVANDILWLKGERMKLRGLGQHKGELRDIDDKNEGHALISRGNACLFREAVLAVGSGRPFAFVGPLGNYRFDQIVDTFNLSVGDQVRDPFLKSFASFEQLAEYAESMDDKEIKARVKLVGEFSAEIPRLVELITQKSLPWTEGIQDRLPANAQVFTTAHKSKGLEFDVVRLADDYQPLIDEDQNLVEVAKMSDADIEEINLQYVAATRAKKVLQLSEGLHEFLELKQQIDRSLQPRMAG